MIWVREGAYLGRVEGVSRELVGTPADVTTSAKGLEAQDF